MPMEELLAFLCCVSMTCDFRSYICVCSSKVTRKVDAEIDIGILCVIPLGTHHIPQTEAALLPGIHTLCCAVPQAQ